MSKIPNDCILSSSLKIDTLTLEYYEPRSNSNGAVMEQVEAPIDYICGDVRQYFDSLDLLYDHNCSHHTASTVSCTEYSESDGSKIMRYLEGTSMSNVCSYNTTSLNDGVADDLSLRTTTVSNEKSKSSLFEDHNDTSSTSHHDAVDLFVDHQRNQSPHRRCRKTKHSKRTRKNNAPSYENFLTQTFDSDDLATLSYVFEEFDCNVLLGQGGKTNKNPGNILFRAQADLLRDEYKVARKKEKRKISQRLVAIMQNMGSKFLKQVNGEKYEEVDYKVAVDKASQVLREGPEVGFEKRKKRKAKKEGKAL